MRFNIISNLSNGIGLQRDFEILREELEALGHTVRGVQFTATRLPEPAEVNLFLEIFVPKMFSAAPEQWIIPNPEWWKKIHTQHVNAFTRVLCKTEDSVRLLLPIAKKRVKFIGFRSRNLYDGSVVRNRRFLHIAGNSTVKNTTVILDAWQKIRHTHLTVVTTVPGLFKRASQTKNVEAFARIPDAQLVELMNTCQFHLCPSKYEGFGHYIHEALGVGALVITSNSPPMNEFHTPADLRLRTFPDGMLELAVTHGINAQDVQDKVQYALDLPDDTIAEYSSRARHQFNRETDDFRARLREIVGVC